MHPPSCQPPLSPLSFCFQSPALAQAGSRDGHATGRNKRRNEGLWTQVDATATAEPVFSLFKTSSIANAAVAHASSLLGAKVAITSVCMCMDVCVCMNVRVRMRARTRGCGRERILHVQFRVFCDVCMAGLRGSWHSSPNSGCITRRRQLSEGLCPKFCPPNSCILRSEIRVLNEREHTQTRKLSSAMAHRGGKRRREVDVVRDIDVLGEREVCKKRLGGNGGGRGTDLSCRSQTHREQVLPERGSSEAREGGGEGVSRRDVSSRFVKWQACIEVA